MARLTNRELCQRTCLTSGAVTFHTVELGKHDYVLREITEALYRQYEAMACTTDSFYSKTDKLFLRQYKTVRYNIADAKGIR